MGLDNQEFLVFVGGTINWVKPGSFPEFNFEIAATFNSPGIHILMLPSSSSSSSSKVNNTSRNYLEHNSYNSDISIHEISLLKVSTTTHFKLKSMLYFTGGVGEG